MKIDKLSNGSEKLPKEGLEKPKVFQKGFGKAKLLQKELIEHTADLARLKLTEAEIKKFLPQLKEILNAFSKLDEVNTNNTKPSFQPVELKNMLREDKIEKCLSQEKALKNSKENKDGYFKGPMAV